MYLIYELWLRMSKLTAIGLGVGVGSFGGGAEGGPVSRGGAGAGGWAQLESTRIAASNTVRQVCLMPKFKHTPRLVSMPASPTEFAYDQI